MTYIDYVNQFWKTHQSVAFFLERSLFVLLPFERVQ